MVSVYNTDGIAAASLFDDQLANTYELALTIKYLRLADNSGGTFNYKSKINPDPSIIKPGAMTADMTPPTPVTEVTLASTDLKGKYKP